MMQSKRYIYDLPGLRTTSEEFRREYVRMCDRLGLDPSMLAAVISFESGFIPSKENPVSGASGLIQFMPGKKTGLIYGMSPADFRKLSALAQLPYVEKHFGAVTPKGQKSFETLEDHYLAVLAPACIGYPGSTVLPCRPDLTPWKRPAEGCGTPPKGAYCQNQGLDRDGDGVITTAEATSRVRERYNKAKSLPPIEVDMGGSGQEPPPPPWQPPPLVVASKGTSPILVLGLGLALGFVATELALRSRRPGRALALAALLPFVPP